MPLGPKQVQYIWYEPVSFNRLVPGTLCTIIDSFMLCTDHSGVSNKTTRERGGSFHLFLIALPFCRKSKYAGL